MTTVTLAMPSLPTTNPSWFTGAGSVWSNTGVLLVGSSGSANSMVISNGGNVFNTLGSIGNNAHRQQQLGGGDRSGSVWSNSSSLIIGSLASGNSTDHRQQWQGL